MGIGVTMKKVFNIPDSRPREHPFLNLSFPFQREPLSPSQTRTSPTQVPDTGIAEQQTNADNQDQPTIKEKASQPSLQAHPSRSPKLNKPRKLSSVTPQHIAERYEFMERELAMDSERSRAHGIAGYGSDAAAAAGASLREVHHGAPAPAAAAREPADRAANKGTTGVARSSSGARKAPPRISPERDTGNTYPPATVESPRPADDPPPSVSAARPEIKSARGLKADTGAATNAPGSAPHAMQPTSEPANRNDYGEIGGSRIKHIERHIHHVQHHIQPIIITEELSEEATDFEQTAEERATIDKDITTVTETTYHHIYHVIQPVFEKETVNKHQIHPTTPLREVIRQTPIADRTQTHSPVSMQKFLESGASFPGNPSATDKLEKEMPLNQGDWQISTQQKLRTADQDLRTKMHPEEPVTSHAAQQSNEAHVVN